MIPKSHSLVTLLPERQAALQAIAAVEQAQQHGTRLARHPWAAAFMKQLSGRSRVSVQTLNRIRGIYLRPREKHAHPYRSGKARWICSSAQRVRCARCRCRRAGHHAVS